MTCKRTDDGWTRDGEPCRTDHNGNPTRHCQTRIRCGRHLAWGEHTCPSCIGDIRRDLRDIEDLATLMDVEATFAGVDSEAANLAGPSADPLAWHWRRANTVRAAWLDGATLDARMTLHAAMEPDMLHPRMCLGTWEHVLREDLQQDLVTPISATLAGSRRYLDWVLTDLAHDEDRTLVLADMAADLRRCRAHLEAVNRDSRVPDLGHACFLCPDPAPRLVRHFGHWCEADDCERLHFADDTADTWACPRNHTHRWTVEEYASAVERARIRHATWLTAADLAARLGTTTATIRKRAERGDIDRKRFEGRVVYRVPDTRTQTGA